MYNAVTRPLPYCHVAAAIPTTGSRATLHRLAQALDLAELDPQWPQHSRYAGPAGELWITPCRHADRRVRHLDGLIVVAYPPALVDRVAELLAEGAQR